MSSGFGELAHQAHEFVAAGNLARARDLLGAALASADPSPGNASPDLTEAAGLHARVLVALGEPHSARGWAAFAYSAATRLYGPSDQRTVATAATLAAVLHRVGSHARAARLYQDVIIELTATDGPESLRVLAAHADLATVEYARGECELARNRLEDSWELHREVYGDGHLSGIRMLARLGAMQRDCGRFTEAHEHLALARELCREHLPADHPLAAQVAALARAAANPNHVCADGQPDVPDTSEVPTARPGAPPDAGAPVVPPAGLPPTADLPPAGGYAEPPAPPPGFPPSVPPAGYPPPGPPERSAPASPAAGLPPSTPPQPAGFPASTPARQVPPPRLPPAPPVDSPPRWAPPVDPPPRWAPLRHAAPGQPARPQVPPPRASIDRAPAGVDADANDPDGNDDLDPDDRWWPPDVAERDPDGTPNSARTPGDQHTESPLPPAVPALASGGAHRELPRGLSDSLDDADGVRRVRHLPEPRRPARLPVRVRHPPQPRVRRMLPIVVAGLVVVLLGTAAVVAGFGQVDDPEPQPSGPAGGASTGPDDSSPSAPVPASPGTPPGEVTLTDSRDSVTLAWTYPVGAEGPVVVAGGRSGQEIRAFQELPAGSGGYVVYGLESQTDYCFSIAVVYSPDLVGRAKPVCTDRATASPAR